MKKDQCNYGFTEDGAVKLCHPRILLMINEVTPSHYNKWDPIMVYIWHIFLSYLFNQIWKMNNEGLRFIEQDTISSSLSIYLCNRVPIAQGHRSDDGDLRWDYSNLSGPLSSRQCPYTILSHKLRNNFLGDLKKCVETPRCRRATLQAK